MNERNETACEASAQVETATPEPAKTRSEGQVVAERLDSVDALRGFDMFWIIGGEHLAIAVLTLIGTPWALRLVTQFDHVEWEGFVFYDLIFPLFLFIVGVVLPFSLDKYTQPGQQPGWPVYRRILRRALLLFLLGMVYNGNLDLDPEEFRIPGVLQRIALCYAAAAILYLQLPALGRMAAAVVILLGYWLLLESFAAPGFSPGDLSPEGNLVGWVDRQVIPGKLWYVYGDNEGLLSTLPAIGTVLLGCFAGQILRLRQPGLARFAYLATLGLTTLAAGTFWGESFPIIKNLWTSSFVLVAGGWSYLLLAGFFLVIDVWKLRRWAFPFVVLGTNAITIYLLSEIVPWATISTFFLGGVVRQVPQAEAVLLGAGAITLQWLLVWHLYRQRIFLRL